MEKNNPGQPAEETEQQASALRRAQEAVQESLDLRDNGGSAAAWVGKTTSATKDRSLPGGN